MDPDRAFSDFMEKFGDKPLLTRTEERDLARRVVKGDPRAREQLIERNVGLVLNICTKYSRMGFELEDLMQEGLVGLIKAVDRFDPERNIKLSTYATWWIKQSVFRYMNGPGGALIRVPGQIQTIRRKVKQKSREANLDEEEAAIEIGITPEEYHEAFTSAPRVTIHLDQGVGDNDDDREDRHERIADPNAVDPADRPTAGGLPVAFSRLPTLRRRVVELRLGFAGDVRTQNETARELGITKKQVKAELEAGVKELREYMVEEGVDPATLDAVSDE